MEPTKEKDRLTPKTMKFSARQLEMIGIIQAENGHTTFSSVMASALIAYFKQTAPPYLRDRLLGKSPDPETAGKHKVAKDEATDEARKEALIKKKKPILDVLEATVKEMGGELVAIYYTHTISSDDRQILPLKAISEELTTNQWAPSRKSVERIRKEKGRKIVKKDGDELPE